MSSIRRMAIAIAGASCDDRSHRTRAHMGTAHMGQDPYLLLLLIIIMGRAHMGLAHMGSGPY